MKKTALFIIAIIYGFNSFSQITCGEGLAPKEEWKSITWAPNEWEMINPGPQTQEESGEDWWYDHLNTYENGEHVGYYGIGYATWVNYSDPSLNYTFVDGCISYDGYDNEGNWFDKEGEFESSERNKGQVRSTVARFNLEGEMEFCKRFGFGAFRDGVTDSEGNTYLVGAINNVIPLDDIELAPGGTNNLHYNPGQNSNFNKLTDFHNCDNFFQNMKEGERHLYVAKVNSQGQLIWNNIYGYYPIEDTSALTKRSWGLSIKLNEDELVCSGATYVEDNIGNDSRLPYFLRIDQEGNYLSSSIIYDPLYADVNSIQTSKDGVTNLAWLLNTVDVRAEDIEVTGVNEFVIVGSTYANSDNAVFAYKASLNNNDLQINNSLNTFSNQWPIDGLDGIYEDYTIPEEVNLITNVGYDNLNTILLPIMTHGTGYLEPDIFQGHVYKVDLSSWEIISDRVDLGEIRAYDKKIGCVHSGDGEWIIVSSKLSEEFAPNAVQYSDLSTSTKDCLADFNPFDWDGNNVELLEYWSTDAYVAKIGQNNDLIWEYTFDSRDDQSQDRECYPGNMKEQECMYNVWMADDGGFTISGNTGDNYDDSYLVKLADPCNAETDYCQWRSVRDANPWNYLEGQENEFYVTLDDSWTQDMAVYGVIRIASGVTLTIDRAKIEFADSRKVNTDTYIYVEKGGRLNVINGAHLTSIESCPGSIWDGIYVEGDVTESQGSYSNPNMGEALIESKSKISHATSALRNYGLTENGNINYNSTGGIIRCYNSTFEDNRRDAEFLSFQNTSSNSNGSPIRDISIFFECNHFTTDNYHYLGSPEASITAWKCEGIGIYGCNFEDQRTANLEPFEREDGIFTIASSLIIDKSTLPVTNPPEPAGVGLPNTFTNLNRAIEMVGNGSPLFNTEIKNNDFISCWRGIHHFGIEHAEIWLNDFEVTPFIGSLQEGAAPAGIYLNECRGYHVEENNLYPFDGAMELPEGVSAGIVVKNMHGDNEQIYRNTIEYLNVGLEAIDRNRLDSQDKFNTGLRFLCNDLKKNNTDIFATHGDIPLDQSGIAKAQATIIGAEILPAGNTFNHAIPPGNTVDIKNEENEINYYWDQDILDEEPLVNLGDVDVFPIIQNDQVDKCPTNLPRQPRRNLRGTQKSSQNEMLNLKSSINRLIDGGNTTQLSSDVVATNNSDAWLRYVDLMNQAGYLSKEVLLEVSRKETGFTDAMIRDILAANPLAAKSEEVQEELDTRTRSLPQYMRNQINLGLGQMSPIEYLILEKNMQQMRHDQATNDAICVLLSDETPTNSILHFIETLSGTDNISFDLKLAEIYDAADLPTLAESLLNTTLNYSNLSADQEAEIQRSIDLRASLQTWIADGANLADLVQSDLDKLSTYLAFNDRAASKAKAILALNDQYVSDDRVYFPSGGGGAALKNLSLENDWKGIQEKHMNIFPNPAREYFILDYAIAIPFESANYQLVDAKGTTVYSGMLNYRQDQLIMENNYSSGIYFLHILVDGQIYDSQKLVLMKF